jgi:hypothetical protein
MIAVDFAECAGRGRTIWRSVASSVTLQLLATVVLHAVIFTQLFRWGVLPQTSYFEPVLVVAAARRPGLILCALLVLMVLVTERRTLRWRAIDAHGRSRWLICGIAAIFAWVHSTYPVNLYFDQEHTADRLLLVGLWIALWFHPLFIAPFLTLVIVIVGQQHAPLPEGTWTWPDKRLPLDLLLSFMSFLLIRALLRGRMRPQVLPLALLCVTGALYGHAAVNKALLGPEVTWWLRHDDLANLFVSSYVQGGWMRQLGDAAAVAFAQRLHTIKFILAAITLLAELSGFLLVINWRLTRILLVLFVAFHIGVVLSSGIFFWKWMVADGLLLWYLTMLHRDAQRSGDVVALERISFFAPSMTALALAVMLSARFVFDLVPFAWFDTKLVNFFEVYGVADSGRRYRLDSRFFAPYDIHMQQSRHYPLLDDTVLVGTYGVSMSPVLASLLETAKPSDLPDLHRKYGQRWTSEAGTAIYVDFIRRYVANSQRRGGRETLVTRLAPPFHFRTTAPKDVYRFQEPISAVEIDFREALYDGETITTTRYLQVARFPIK